MPITNVTLYNLVGDELGLLSGAEVLSTEDSDKIASRASGVRSWLIDEGIAFWADDAIPDAVKLSLAKIIASECKAMFGRSDYADGPTGYQELRQHCSKRSARQPVAAEYF